MYSNNVKQPSLVITLLVGYTYDVFIYKKAKWHSQSYPQSKTVTREWKFVKKVST